MKAQKSMTSKVTTSPKMGKMPASKISKAEVVSQRVAGMKEGGKADMAQDKAMLKKAFKQHDAQEHKGGKGTKLALKKGGKADIPHMGFGGMLSKVIANKVVPLAKTIATKVAPAMPQVPQSVQNNPKVNALVSGVGKALGKAFRFQDGGSTKGVKMDNSGGYKNGGDVPAEKDRSLTKTTETPSKKISTARRDNSYNRYATGGVAMLNAATGGVALSNAGGFKNGGASKKHYATGGVVNTGKPVAMPQGNQPVPAPKTQQNFSGTYKKGGKVENTRLRNALDTQNAPDMKNAKLDDNLKYPKTMNSPQKVPKFV
jgi:hypothetical protein